MVQMLTEAHIAQRTLSVTKRTRIRSVADFGDLSTLNDSDERALQNWRAMCEDTWSAVTEREAEAEDVQQRPGRQIPDCGVGVEQPWDQGWPDDIPQYASVDCGSDFLSSLQHEDADEIRDERKSRSGRAIKLPERFRIARAALEALEKI